MSGRVVQVTLTLEMCEGDMPSGEVLNQIRAGRTDGITEAGSAAALVGAHPAEHGYIHWRAEPYAERDAGSDQDGERR